MKCSHCREELFLEEIDRGRQEEVSHGISWRWCKACWSAWGVMVYGWQPGCIEGRKVRFTEREAEWEARRK